MSLGNPPPPAARIRESGVRISASTPVLKAYHQHMCFGNAEAPSSRAPECSDVLANFVTPFPGAKYFGSPCYWRKTDLINATVARHIR